MKRPDLRSVGLVLTLSLMGCGGGVTYYKVAESYPSVLSGSDCPGNTTQTITIAGVDGDGTVAIYGEPNSEYYIDLGQAIGNVGGPAGLTGSLASGVYNFTGSWSENVQATPEIQTTLNVTLQLTQSGPGVTGTLKYEFICKGDGSGCGEGNPLSTYYPTIASTDKGDFDCVETVSLVGTQISGPTEISPTSSSQTPVN